MAYADAVNLGGNVRITHFLTLPLDDDPFKSRANWQGATYAEDPRNGNGFLYQGQINPVGPKDVEDLWVHVFQIKGGGASPAKPIYKFSTLVKRAGHVQSIHVRISIKGNHWLWAGCENYKANKTSGTSLWRMRLRRGRITLGKSADCKKIITGPGSVGAVGNFDGAGKANFTITLRRPESKTEVYEWYNEADLIKHRNAKVKPKVYAAMRVPREGGTYQSSCALGTFKTANKNGVIHRINGSTAQQSRIYKYPKVGTAVGIFNKLRGVVKKSVWDITNYAPKVALPVTSEEGEAVMVGPGRILLAGKRANSTKRRRVFYGQVRTVTPVA